MHEHFETHEYEERRWPIVAGLILVLLIVATIVEGSFLISSVVRIRPHAQTSLNGIRSYVDSAKKGNQEKLVQAAQDVSAAAHDLQQELGSIPWTVALIVPVVGSDVRSAQALAEVLVDISDEALVPLAQESEMMSLSNLMQEGAVNMQALEDVSSVVRKIEPVLSKSSKTVEALPPAHVEQLASVLETVRDAITTASDAILRVNPLLGDLPTLLGANGQERHYLMVASNNGELHAAGGYVGSVGILTVNDGHFSMGDFGDIRNVLPEDSVSAGATTEEIEVFGERVDTHHGDHNMIPDFSRVGQLYYNIWNTANNMQLDGVIGVDPIFLQRILKLVGKVDTSYGVSVDGNNAAAVIINECLFYGWEPTRCDDFYSEVASNSFDKLISRLGSLDTLALMETLTTSATEGRCNAWVCDEAIEEHIKSAGFGWELPHDATSPMLGVFVSDMSTTKSAYYLSIDTTLGDPTSNTDGSQTYTVTSTIKHNMDYALLSGDLPGYIVTGWSTIAETRSRVELLERVSLIAPEGGRIANVAAVYENPTTLPAPQIEWSEHSYQGLKTWRADVRIDAGETCIASYTVTTSPQTMNPLSLRQSPAVPHEIRGD